MSPRAYLLCAVSVLVLAAAAPALAAPVGAIRLGRPPTLPVRAQIAGALPGAQRLHVAVTLSPRDPAALSAYATAVATPGSPDYRRYLTVAQFARRFGPARSEIASVRSALRARGLRPGAVSANGLAIGVSATAAQLERSLSVGIERVMLADGRTAFANTVAPSLPASVARYVQAVVGLNTLAVPQPVSLARRAGSRAAVSPALARAHVATGGPQPCAAATAAAPTQQAYTVDQLASAYGFSGLYAGGDQGAGQTIAVYELEGDFPADIAAYQACYGTNATVSYVSVDGGPPPPSVRKGDGSETEFDVETLIGLAPQAHIVVYQAPNSGSGAPGSGPYDAYSAIVSQDTAKVITTSWGECEAQEGSADADAEEILFEEAATQGQTILAAAGDDGSEDCGGRDTDLAVDDPGSDPYVTSVGGTSLTSLGPPPTETVWNDSCQGSPCGGGGGISSLWTMPSYQSQALSALGVVGAASSGAPCGAPAGSYCREVPDVAADADPATGYLVYYDGSWQGIGGTSGSTPLWAALIALANASSACASTPVGFLNPSLYIVASGAVAGASYASTFYDIAAGENDILNAHGGLYGAGPGFDMASGLGAPNAATLAPALCAAAAAIKKATTTSAAPKLALTSPGNQSTTVGARVQLQLKASTDDGGKLSYGATGLPAGLAIDATTGLISGTPSKPGQSHVSVTAKDSGGGSGSVSFRWTIAGLPTASHTGLSGLARRRPKLRFTVRAGVDGPALRAVQVRLPAGLSFTSGAEHITVSGPGGKRAKASGRLSHGVLTVTFASPLASAQATLSFPALRASAALAGRAQRRRPGTLRVVVTATDASRRATALMLRLAV